MKNSQLLEKVVSWSKQIGFAEYVANPKTYGEEVVIFDTETRGLSGIEGEIIDIGAVTVKNGLIRAKDGTWKSPEWFVDNNRTGDIDMFGYLIMPERGEISDEITQLTHIDMNLIRSCVGGKSPNKTAKNFTEAFVDFMAYVGRRGLAAHNCRFDRARIRENVSWHLDSIVEASSIRAVSEFFDNWTLDTLVEVKKLYPAMETVNFKNATLAAYFGLGSNEHMLHRAFYDSIFTAKVFSSLADRQTKIIKETLALAS